MEPNQDQQPQDQPPVNEPAFPQPQHAPQPMPQPYAVPQENPGQTFGILSIVMIFVFPILGIVFGAMSRSKSKAANMPSGLGTAGLIVNIIVTVLGVLFTILAIILILAASASEANQSTKDSSSSDSSSLGTNSGSLDADAKIVQRHAELYNAETGDYPKSVSDFSKLDATKLPNDMYVNGSIYTNTNVTYIYCGAGAAQIVYLGTSESDKKITALGAASSTEACPRAF